MKKKLGVFLTIVLALVIVFLGFVGYGSINNRWYKVLAVTSGSMSPVFEAGDLIVVTKTSPDKVKVGDIITFSVKGALDTHRVVEKNGTDFKTKGDANKTADDWDEIKIVPGGKYLFHIPKLGYVTSFLRGTGSCFVDAKTSSINIESAIPTPSPTPSPTPEPTLEPSPTPTPETTLDPTPTATPTETLESSPTPEPTLEPSPTPSPTPEPTEAPNQ